MYNHIAALIKLGMVKPIIGNRYPLEHASKAQYDIINNKGATGRLTLVI
jgi:hypothetical protein